MTTSAWTAATATPAPVPVPSSQPDHGPWLAWLVVGGFVLAGVLTLALARRNGRRGER